MEPAKPVTANRGAGFPKYSNFPDIEKNGVIPEVCVWMRKHNER